MKIKAGDLIRIKGTDRWAEVLRVSPDFGVFTYDPRPIDPAKIVEVKRRNFSSELTSAPWRWEWSGNMGCWILVGDDGRGSAIGEGPCTADGQLMEAAPDLLRLYETCRAFGSQLPIEVFEELLRVQEVIEPIVRPNK